MNLRAFVSGSAVVLIGWLALSFFHRPTSQRYPSAPVAGTQPGKPAPAAAAEDLASAHSSSP